jgi:hypothetical protein
MDDDDRSGLPTAEQFRALCQQRVPLMLAALQGGILLPYVHQAIVASHMPMWARMTLLGAYPPRVAPSAARDRQPTRKASRGASRSSHT